MAYGTVNADVIGTSVAGSNIGAGNASIMKNRIINGAMVIDQRNAGASVTPTNGQYLTDRWSYSATQASKFTAQQNQGSVTPPVGFTKYLGLTSSSAYSVSATDIFKLRQFIEGFNIADLGWGTANAKTVTLSFQVYSSLTGTFGGALLNQGENRSYPFSYSISVANTWTTISVTIAGDTTGTWDTDNTLGIRVNFGLGVGSTYSGTAGAWSGTRYESATGATSVVGTNGATFYITGVQLEVGSSATGFEYRQYGQELALCQRYFEVYVSGGNNTGIMAMSTGSTTSGRGTYIQKVQKRANPSSVTFLAANQYLYQGAGINAQPSAISVAVSSPSAVLVDVTISGATAFQTANLLENSAAGTNIISISAEL
jgi:hypothetical protein